MKALVVTPVKDALEETMITIKSLLKSDIPFVYWVFNDYSTPETKKELEVGSQSLGFELIHLEEITSTPSPNYKTVLQTAQKEAIKLGLPLVIVESDVTVKKDTLRKLLTFGELHASLGMAGAITHDKEGKVNFPYLKFKDLVPGALKTKRSLSFCCTLLSLEFLEKYDFVHLDTTKDWFDTHISQKALDLGFDNYILTDVPVTHRPHASRPWKLLKYKNPLLYYFKKWFMGKDKI
jgi:hypothetical protein